jgi:hypothetical protein
MVLFLTEIFKWAEVRNSSNRISYLDHPPTNKREFALNPHFLSDLKTHTLGSTFKYSENPGDRREGSSTIICDKTVSEIIAYMDTPADSNAITLPICPSNNSENTPVDTTIQWATIAFVSRYNLDPENFAWVVYDRGSFKRVQVLVNLALEDVVGLVRTGTTSTTYSTVEDYFD